MKKIFAAIVAIFGLVSAYGQTTYDFAVRGQDTLRLDIYRPSSAVDKHTVVVYVFGGGFIMGSRTEVGNVAFYEQLTERGYTVAAIDYRLGLKGVTKVGALNPRPAFNAVKLATEDLISAVDFLIKRSQELKIDTSGIVFVGSSAGAITALQTSYEISRRSAMARSLPETFHPAAVVSLAGAIFSKEGKPKYGATVPPTAFFHGTEDKVVVYKKIQVLKLGMFGTDALVKIFNDGGYPYLAVRYEGSKHEVAEFPRTYAIDQICTFIDAAVSGTYTNEVDMTVKDRYVQQNFKMNLTRKDLYNGN